MGKASEDVGGGLVLGVGLNRAALAAAAAAGTLGLKCHPERPAGGPPAGIFDVFQKKDLWLLEFACTCNRIGTVARSQFVSVSAWQDGLMCCDSCWGTLIAGGCTCLRQI